MSRMCTIRTYIETNNLFSANKFWNDESGIGLGSKAPLNYTDLDATAFGILLSPTASI